MRTIKRVFWGSLSVLALLWLIAEPTVFQSKTFFGLRAAMIQLTGVVAIGAMSLAMVLALRPRAPERWLGGLDKMYRLHKWYGIAALIAAVIHWLWTQGPKWAVGWGWLERPVRGARRTVENPVEAYVLSLRGSAETVGEWAFYAAVVLIALALLRYFPYRLFYKTHRLLALSYGVLAFHTVVLMDFHYWASPIGWMTAALLAAGLWATAIILLRRVGVDRQVKGTIVAFHHYPGVKSLETEIEVPRTWPGHKPGQFAFAMSDTAEGAHPYTIASSWHPENPRISFITRELGDHTSRLRERLKLGQEVRVEGPYGCFTFDDACPQQIWVGAGIGITPFIARMKHLAARAGGPERPADQAVHLFHCTTDVDEKALEKLASDAKAANVRLHIVIDSRHGRLTGARIREVVPEWRDASIWFCGPTGFGHALERDFAALGFPVNRRFHQELFAMR